MSKPFKKSVSILLAVIMVVSLFTIVPITASAAQVDSYAAVGAGEHFTQDDETLTPSTTRRAGRNGESLHADNARQRRNGERLV